MAVLKLNNANYINEVKKTKMVVVIDFYANWCAPCKMMAPVIEEIAKDFPEVKVYKANVDDTPIVANEYQVQSIPTIVVMKDNEIVKKFIGVTPKAEIENAIKLVL